MQKHPLISIVIPAYNAERYLERAVYSLKEQTFQDFEVIIVDDGSADGTGKISDRLSKELSGCRVVHLEKNGGLSNARNQGKKLASGKYIWYMDADDYVEPYLLEKAADSIKIQPAKLIMFGLIEEYWDENMNCTLFNVRCPKEAYYSDKRSLREKIIDYERDTYLGYAWNKIFDLEYQRRIGLEFENVELIEDILFTAAFIRNIDSMNVLGIAPYHYGKKVKNNLTNRFVPRYFYLHRRRIGEIRKLYQEWGMYTDSVRSKLGSLYARYILSAAERKADKRSGYSPARRRAWAERVCRDRLFKELVPGAEAEDSLSLKALILLLRMQSPGLLTMMGGAMHFIRYYCPVVYNRTKKGR